MLTNTYSQHPDQCESLYYSLQDIFFFWQRLSVGQVYEKKHKYLECSLTWSFSKITIVGCYLGPLTFSAWTFDQDYGIGLKSLLWSRPHIKLESNWLPYNSHDTCSMSTSCLAIWYWSMQGPVLGKTIDFFFPLVAYMASSGTVKACQQEVSFLVKLR